MLSFIGNIAGRLMRSITVFQKEMSFVSLKYIVITSLYWMTSSGMIRGAILSRQFCGAELKG